MKKRIFATLFVLVATPVLADDIALGTPAYGGNGCPLGSASATLSPDAKSLNILFDEFIVDAGPRTGRTAERKTCNISIPIHVPPGLSVAISALNHRGSNDLPETASSQVNVSYFFAGVAGPQFSRTFNGPLLENYDTIDRWSAGALTWSPCGIDVMLRMNTSLSVRSNNPDKDAKTTINQLDVGPGLSNSLQWRRC
jgi:hypothetical protein